ncbi:MAG: PTS sugar transporter subunit IIA [Sphaerochaeta associata]|uniref:PTS sugar transporter subunit IIA n=1 Tax=Sphaerochaeta associata TaxID=1129264 RepID=UPI002B1F1FAA|nr:PTS sugar transporter subunit IIA [Sphaerochaeta associata]MEA5106553.1 PTS sugar transporter subunit IIA [Sphaerochaeta associata]
MANMRDLLDQRCILLDRSEQTIEGVIKTLTDQLHAVKADQVPENLTERVIDGGFHTTCMGEGCAITHARCPSMQKTLLAAMRLTPPLDLKALDGKRVVLVFLLVGPQKSSSFHLRILSKLARLLHQSDLREALITSKSSIDFHTLIADKE